MKYFNFFLFLLFLIIKRINGSSPSDTSCLDILYPKVGLSKMTDYCLYNQCDSNDYITGLILTGLTPTSDSSTPSIGYYDFSCLTKLNSIQLTNFKLDITVYSLNYGQIILNNCDLQPFSSVTTSGTFVINGSSRPINFALKLSYIIDTSTVRVYGTNISIIVTSDVTKAGALRSLRLKSNNVPDLTYAQLNDFDFIYGEGNIDSTSIVNFKTWSKIKVITISSLNTLPVPFPTSLNQVSTPSSIQSITTSCPFQATTALIDFSTLTGLSSLTLSNVGALFSLQPDNSWPFTNLPPAAKFSIAGGSFLNLPQLSLFNGANTVTVQSNTFTSQSGLLSDYSGNANPTGLVSIIGNQLTGPITDSYCSLDILKYSFKNNQLSGTLPQCFSCHSGDPTLSDIFSANGFIASTIPCTISPYIRIEPISGTSTFQIRLLGTNLGYSTTWFQTTPNTTWTMVKPSFEFLSQPISNSNAPSILNIKFTSANNLQYTISMLPNQLPVVNGFYQDTTITPLSFRISGQYFTNVLTNVTVVLDGNTAQISKTLFDEIIFPVSGSVNITNKHALLSVTIDGTKTTKAYVSLVTGDTNIGTCSTTCKEPNGICNLNTGTCSCNDNFQGTDCSLPFIPCLNNCNGANGQCDNQTGTCFCSQEWTGTSCAFDAISASSISVNVTEAGGIVEIIGYFSKTPNQALLSVVIGSETCVIQSVTSSKILCQIGQGTGKKPVHIVYNTISYDKLVFEYVSSVKPCVQTCKNGGNCDTTKGTCVCATGYSGLDCGALSNGGGSTTTSSTTGNNNGGSTPGSNSNVNSTNGGSSINNQQTSYEIFLSTILELDLTGKAVATYSLKDNWKLENSTQPIDGANRIVFTQSIKQSKLTFTIDEITASPGKDYSFAGIDFLVTTGSLKMQFAISNWTYENNLNSLQLQMESTVEDLKTATDQDKCINENQKDTSIEAVESDGTLAYMTISKNNKIFYGRFIDRCLSEGRSTLISSNIVSKSDSNVIIGINLPHCKECAIDPDFSVLVSPDFTDSCDNSSSRSWVLPVAIVVPCVAVAIIVTVTILVLKKNRMNIKLKLDKFKSFSMKSFKN